MVKVLAFSGSTRSGSLNQALVENAADAAREAGAEVTVINLADYAMPIFNQDEEDEYGIPERAQAFKQLLIEHDAFLIASPEYNSSYPAVLKMPSTGHRAKPVMKPCWPLIKTKWLA